MKVNEALQAIDDIDRNVRVRALHVLATRAQDL